MKIEEIRAKIGIGEYRFSDHAVKRMINRSIERAEIEEYPDDKYSPSCLIYGMSIVGRHLHIQLSLPPTVVVITAYDPHETEWINYRVRRTNR